MQTKAFDILYREMTEQTKEQRIHSYANHCKKLTPNQKAILILYLFDSDARDELMKALYNSRRYAEAGMVCIYQNSQSPDKLASQSHD